MNWLEYETYQLYLKINHKSLTHEVSEDFFLKVLTLESGNDYTFFSALHSIIKLLNLGQIFPNDYLFAVLKIL